MANLVVGLAATKAPWSAAFRSYVRDHTQGIAVEVIMDRTGLARSAPRLDVMVVDDVMRTLSSAEIANAQRFGTYVIGLYDHSAGMGREYLFGLGTDQVLPASTPPADLVAVMSDNRRRPSAASRGAEAINIALDEGPMRPKGKRALVSAWTKVSGGSGLTETTVAAAQHLAKAGRALLIEADEVAPVLASRLLRSTSNGLAWAVARAGQGRGVLPEGLSGPREDGTAAVGHFDVICGTPGAGQVIPAADILRLLDEAARAYDHVLVETGWLVGAPSGRERFSAARALLASADAVVVLASADPEGAARLVEWKAAAMAAGCRAPCWAAFGRARPSRYERGHLTSLLHTNTGRHRFESVWFLPEDPTVARARWNAEIVWKGPWLKAVKALADTATVKGASPLPTGDGFRRPLRSTSAAGRRAEVAPL
jgi:hypothetical protein